MKRIANYREGDRAESFGIALMQLLCAMTPVPRQEEFGIFDAVATLLRRDGRFLFAEDSFLVQFKSRTERVIEYRGDRFKALLNQELMLLVGHVDLTAAAIALYNVSTVLTHPNIRDVNGLVVYIGPADHNTDGGVLHVSLGEPILKWNAAQLSDRESEQRSYDVLKAWLDLDRWNRRCRTMGIQAQTKWTTNATPMKGPIAIHWNPTRAKETLSDVIPAIQVIGALGVGQQTLSKSVLGIIEWMREQGVNPDPSGSLTLMLVLSAARPRLDSGLASFPEAHVAMQFLGVSDNPDDFEFWVQFANREGKTDATKHTGSVTEIEALGFVVGVDSSTNRVAKLDVGETWLTQRGLEKAGEGNGVLLLRRAQG
jgi:hypothetical protein